jgi:hypothetical protein
VNKARKDLAVAVNNFESGDFGPAPQEKTRKELADAANSCFGSRTVLSVRWRAGPGRE